MPWIWTRQRLQLLPRLICNVDETTGPNRPGLRIDLGPVPRRTPVLLPWRTVTPSDRSNTTRPPPRIKSQNTSLHAPNRHIWWALAPWACSQFPLAVEPCSPRLSSPYRDSRESRDPPGAPSHQQRCSFRRSLVLPRSRVAATRPPEEPHLCSNVASLGWQRSGDEMPAYNSATCYRYIYMQASTAENRPNQMHVYARSLRFWSAALRFRR